MTEWVIRVLFLCASGSLGYQVARLLTAAKTAAGPDEPSPYAFWGILAGVGVAALVMIVEAVFSKRPIQTISAIVFGLITGFLLAILFHAVVMLAVGRETHRAFGFPDADSFERMIKLGLIVIFTYLGIAVIYKTRHNFRFIIPYVEFQKEEKRRRPIVVDTSAIIDGRLAEICETKIIDAPLIMPKFVIQELQNVADSPDRLRRNRGRRGLEVLNRLQRAEHIDVQIHDGRRVTGNSVDSKLISLASQLQARIITCDYNLSRIAELQGVEVININDLANALKPIKLPGEEVQVKVIRQGDEPGQGVGYLSDGTMVVIEQARDKIGETVTLTVTSVLQTSAGRMIFGRLKEHA